MTLATRVQLTQAALIVMFVWSAGLATAQQGQPEAPMLIDAPGRDVVLQICGECHDAAARITKLRRSRDEWADLITDMQNRGMRADEKELETTLAYLSSNYGKPADKR